MRGMPVLHSWLVAAASAAVRSCRGHTGGGELRCVRWQPRLLHWARLHLRLLPWRVLALHLLHLRLPHRGLLWHLQMASWCALQLHCWLLHR